MPVWVTTSLPPVNLRVIWHSSSATLRRFVFVNPRKFDLKALFTQRPDFEFGAFRLPGAVDLSGCDALVTVRLRRNK